ncbi:hypothetical protein CCACVL1_19103 [Corchorus capsularis]|uniref:Viral movement protein n=1 Tax=Corchorus capsularis TaxID=210143 RepID=A0A1R3HIC9_COCAP|nr:hypothetical protein CCACVL1_19103 [Corchorus capsularis]
MAQENTETSPSIPKSFFSQPPSTLETSTGYILRNLYEIRKIRDSNLPTINPYEIFTKPSTSLFKSVKNLLNSSPHKPKEHIQVTRFQKQPIPSGELARIFTLQLPHQSLQKFITQGYSYIHVGAIRLGLTFHVRKGVPLATRIALHDSRHKEYQHSCLGMVETTLNSGTIVATFYPNYTMFLQDKTMATAFQVQLQIVGASMDPGLVQATLHYQMAYKVQNHALGSALHSYGDIPLIQVDSQNKPTAIRIPINIPKEQLVSIIPETWVAIYENYRKEDEKNKASSNTLTRFRSLQNFGPNFVVRPMLQS